MIDLFWVLEGFSSISGLEINKDECLIQELTAEELATITVHGCHLGIRSSKKERGDYKAGVKPIHTQVFRFLKWLKG